MRDIDYKKSLNYVYCLHFSQYRCICCHYKIRFGGRTETISRSPPTGTNYHGEIPGARARSSDAFQHRRFFKAQQHPLGELRGRS